MSPIRLILVRHGNTFESTDVPTQTGSRTDLELTSQGCKQIEAFAAYLKKENIQPSAIYAGSLKRQIKSSQIIGKNLNAEKLIHLNEPALTEIDYGLWEGLTTPEIMEKWPAEYQSWTQEAKWPSLFGSREEEHLYQIRSFLDKLRHAYKANETVVGVTSNGVIRFFYSFQHPEWESLIKARKIEDLKVKTGHFCELLLFKDCLQIKSWNKNPETLC